MIRLGIVGFGGRASGILNSELLAVDPSLRVTAIVDLNPEAARARLPEAQREDVLFYDTLDEMVRSGKVDALLIGTRCSMHTPYAIQAAQYDLPLYLEKPVSVTMEQAIALEEAFQNTRCKAIVSFPLRLTQHCMITRNHILDGAVGRPQHIMANNYVAYGSVYFGDFYRDYSVTQGLFLQKATHDLDYSSFLMGSPIVKIAATHSLGRVFGGKKPAGLRCEDCSEARLCTESLQNRMRNCSPGFTWGEHACLFSEDIGTPETGMNEDCSSALLTFANGTVGVYTQVFFTRRDAGSRGAVISGYNGTISFDWATNDIKLVHHHSPETSTSRLEPGSGHGGGDRELAYNFIDIINGHADPLVTIFDGIQSVYACLAAKQSAETRQFVDVRQVLTPATYAYPCDITPAHTSRPLHGIGARRG